MRSSLGNQLANNEAHNEDSSSGEAHDKDSPGGEARDGKILAMLNANAKGSNGDLISSIG